jgi:hypothetical protein
VDVAPLASTEKGNWTYDKLAILNPKHKLLHFFNFVPLLQAMGLTDEIISSIVDSQDGHLNAACLALYGCDLVSGGFSTDDLIALAASRGGGRTLAILHEEWPILRAAMYTPGHAYLIARSTSGASKIELLSLYLPELMRRQVTVLEQVCTALANGLSKKALEAWLRRKVGGKADYLSNAKRLAAVENQDSILVPQPTNSDAYQMIRQAMHGRVNVFNIHDPKPAFLRMEIAEEVVQEIATSPGGAIAATILAIYGEHLLEVLPEGNFVAIAKAVGGASTLVALAEHIDFLREAGFASDFIVNVAQRKNAGSKFNYLAQIPASQIKQKITPLLTAEPTLFSSRTLDTFKFWLTQNLR